MRPRDLPAFDFDHDRRQRLLPLDESLNC